MNHTILAVECSAIPASCAVLSVTEDGERVLCTASTNTKLTHSQTLLPMVHDMLKNAGLTMADIDTLAVAVGPGSFTGVRIGVAAIKGLSFADDLPCAPVSTLAGMAARFEGFPFEGLILAVMDARCAQVYTALFSMTDGKVSRVTPDEAIAMEDLRVRLSSYTQPILMVGDGAALCCEALKAAIPNLHLAPPGLRYQHAVGIAREAVHLISDNALVSGEALLPSYLRLPQAERELRMKQGK